MAEKRRFERPVHMLHKPGQSVSLVLADGFRFMLLVRGERPSLVPIFQQGRYTIDTADVIPPEKYPVGVLTVDAAQVPMMRKIPASTVDRMLSAVAKHIAQADSPNA